MFFSILLAVTLVAGFIFSVSLGMFWSSLFKIPLHEETRKLLPEATEGDKAIYYLFTNIGILQSLLTPMPVLWLMFQPGDIIVLEAIAYFVGSLLFGTMVFIVALISVKQSKKIFSLLIINPNEAV
ncbi:TPA: hypothetical protein DEP94_03425 [Candidatus Nomurabacteria bacterium]|nr:hypothetical protein [Candidatus Nomurabacteria bacterium]